jgi:hypothetical protein
MDVLSDTPRAVQVYFPARWEIFGAGSHGGEGERQEQPGTCVFSGFHFGVPGFVPATARFVTVS